MYYEENDYESEDDNNVLNDYTNEIVQESNNDKKISTIMFYRDLLSKEPEFVGIKNMSGAKMLEIIQSINLNTVKKYRLTKKSHILTKDQITIFNNLYFSLKINFISKIKKNNKNKEFNKELNDIKLKIYNVVTNIIFSKIYV